MLVREWIMRQILGINKLVKTDGEEEAERLTLINDRRKIVENKLKEANVWYQGDSDEILNMYTYNTNIEYNYEPIYSRNKREYFWSRVATESDVKRTHSGQPRNIVDTLVAIVGEPEIKAGNDKVDLEKTPNVILKKILDENEFTELLLQEQRPMTLVEGWGCYKDDFDLDESDYPILKYYHAKDVEYIKNNNSNKLKGIIFKDYYTDMRSHEYMFTETRYHKGKNLIIKKNAFAINGNDVKELTQEDLNNIDELKGISLEGFEISNYGGFLATPCLYYKDTSNNDGYGRSIYTGKFDLFDDLDQCLSQSSNTVRRSTAIEYFNTDFLERDKSTGMPLMPKSYDRKYTGYVGGKDADGGSTATQPVQVTQPQLQFNEYSREAQDVLLQIISGLMSPATMGIDVAKKDNADAQREKEKVTIFTRNILIRAESKIIEKLCNELLVTYELMHTGRITCTDYSVSVKYSEFADDSFENKLSKLGEAYVKGVISTDMYLSKLYGDTLSEAELENEKNYLEETKQNSSGEGMGMDGMLNDQDF